MLRALEQAGIHKFCILFPTDFTNSAVNDFILATPFLPLLKKEAFPGRGEKVSNSENLKEDICSSFKSHITWANVTQASLSEIASVEERSSSCLSPSALAGQSWRSVWRSSVCPNLQAAGSPGEAAAWKNPSVSQQKEELNTEPERRLGPARASQN